MALNGKRIYQFNQNVALDDDFEIGIDKYSITETEKTSINKLKRFILGNVTVGTGGTYDYEDPSLAILEGKRNLLIMTDVTWSSDIGAITDNIYIYSDTEKIINVSVSNTSDVVIIGEHINFSITGTNQIFTDNTKLYIDFCKITGNTDANNFNSNGGEIYSKDLVVNTGDGDCIFGITYCQVLEINGGGTSAGVVGYLTGIILYLKLTGTFKYFVGGSLEYSMTMNEYSTIVQIYDTSTNGSISMTRGCKISGGNVTVLEVREDLTNIEIDNMKIDSWIYVNNNSTNKINAITNTWIYKWLEQTAGNYHLTLLSYANNTTFAYTINIDGDEIRFDNCKFSYLNIYGDKNRFNTLYANYDVTVDATADKTVFIMPLTANSIIDNNPTSTQIVAPNTI